MLAHLTAIYEKGEKYFIGYCPEVPGANGQGEILDECRESLKEAIKLILSEQSCPGSPEAIRLAMRKPPHLKPEDIDELEREIEKGKNQTQSKGDL
jgi:predicted RNase H-like HicB family nuclease